MSMKHTKRRLRDSWLLIQFAWLGTIALWRAPTLVEWERSESTPKKITMSLTFLNHLFRDEMPEEYR